MNFEHKEETIRENYRLADFLIRFVDNAISQFYRKWVDKQTEYELIVSDFSHEELKKFILIEIPFGISNENPLKRLLDKFQAFIHHKLDIAVKWSIEKIRSLFRLKR